MKEVDLASSEEELFFHFLLTCHLPWLNADKFVEILQLCWKRDKILYVRFSNIAPKINQLKSAVSLHLTLPPVF